MATLQGPGFHHGAVQSTSTPPKVDAAFDVVRWGSEIDQRELRPEERQVYNAALEVLRLYLSGEMSFKDEYSPPKSEENADQHHNVSASS